MSRSSRQNANAAGANLGVPSYPTQGSSGSGGQRVPITTDIHFHLTPKGKIQISGPQVQAQTVQLQPRTQNLPNQPNQQAPWNGGGGGGAVLQECILAASTLAAVTQQQFALTKQINTATTQLLTALTQMGTQAGMAMPSGKKYRSPQQNYSQQKGQRQAAQQGQKSRQKAFAGS